ncbi:MAG: LytTR family DNA-binding domain-containing protein [Acidobacteriota bacterium]
MTRTLRAVLADDEPLARRRLQHALAADPDLIVAAECANGIETLAALEREQPDVLFLDVRMPGLDGLGVLDAIPIERRPRVVFVTAYDRYAVRAFELRAIDYVLKPYDDERLLAAVARVREAFDGAEPAPASSLGDVITMLQRLHEPAPPPVAVRTRRGTLLVPVDEIDWVEAEDNYVRLHVGGKSHLLRSTLSEMEERLPPRAFLRVHRGAIVNIERVRELQPSTHGDFKILLRDGAVVPMSRRFRTLVEQRLGVEL